MNLSVCEPYTDYLYCRLQGMKQLEGCSKRLEELFIKSFYYHGLLVGRYPAQVLISTLVLTVTCMTGLPSVQINLDLYKLFVPWDAPVRQEFERFLLCFIFNEGIKISVLNRKVAIRES